MIRFEHMALNDHKTWDKECMKMLQTSLFIEIALYLLFFLILLKEWINIWHCGTVKGVYAHWTSPQAFSNSKDLEANN